LSIGKKDDSSPGFTVSAAGAVTVSGTITIGAGSTDNSGIATAAENAASAAQTTATSAGNAASTAQSDATSAGNAASTAQSDATSAGNAASAAQADATSAGNAASTAQSAIDTMETQLVLDSGGMELWTTATAIRKVAKFGTTTTLWDGNDDEDANRKLQMDSNGVRVYADDTNTYANLSSAGLTIFNNDAVADPTTGVAHFGTTIRVGAIADDTSRLEISNTGNLSIINRQGTTDTSVIQLTNAGAGVFKGSVSAGSKTTYDADGNDGVFLGSSGISVGDANEFTVSANGDLLTDGNAEIRGTMYVRPAGGIAESGDCGIYINKTHSSGRTYFQVGGPNTEIWNGSANESNPLGTPKLMMMRGSNSNGSYIQFTRGAYASRTQDFCFGTSNKPDSLEDNFRMTNTGQNLYDDTSPYGRHDAGTGDAGFIMVMHSGENKVGINVDTEPVYQLDVDGTIRATGNIIAYSDIRKKKKIKTIDSALEKVNALRGVEFEWKTSEEVNKENEIKAEEKAKKEGKEKQFDLGLIGWDGESDKDWDRPKLKTRLGVIAQEIEKVIPEVVFEDPSDGFKSVSYGNLTALLIEAIKEQSKEMDNLKEQIKELQNGTTK